MTNKDKKELACKLFVSGAITSQGELARRIGVREATVSKWKKDGGWEDMKKSLLVTREEELKNLMDQLVEVNHRIKSKPEGSRYPDTKEADIQTKLTASIRKLTVETSIAEIIDVMIGFNEFIGKLNIQHAQLINDYQDAYIKSKLR